jgi:hypothetical protein
MNMSNNGSTTNFFSSGPPTPSETNAYFGIGQAQIDASYTASNQAMFSQPSSAVPSRASSPVMHQGRGNMAAYNRQHPIQTSTNNMTAGRYPVYNHSSSNSASGDFLLLNNNNNNNNKRSQTGLSFLHLSPDHGPTTGGNEIAILGEHFVPGTRILFGDHAAPSVKFLSPTSLLVSVPPSPIPGAVDVTFSPPTPSSAGASSATTPKSVYRYADPAPSRDDMFIMALKYLAAERLGSADQWQAFARSCANKFLQQQVAPAGLIPHQKHQLHLQNYIGQQQQQQQQQQQFAARPSPSSRSASHSRLDSLVEKDAANTTTGNAPASSASSMSPTDILSRNYAAATAAAVAVASRMGLKAC